MSKYKLWCVYVPLLEQWTREIGAHIEASIDTDHEDFLEVEYFEASDPRIKLYGWTNFPLFAAVKYEQPYKEIIGKQSLENYNNWLITIGWKLKE